MSDTTDGDGDEDVSPYKVRRAHERLDDHEQTHQHFDTRISRNENWRLQIQGALKVIIGILGAGGLTYALEAIGLF